MKIAIFGLAVSSAWGNGHATHWRGLCRELGNRGHDVTFFEKDVPYYAAHRDLTGLPGGRLVLYSRWDDISGLASQSAAEADVGLVTSYCPDALMATELLLSSRCKLRVFYDLDTPVTLAMVRNGESCPYVPPEGLRGFDMVLSYTGGPALDELGSTLGARRVASLYGSVDPEVHFPVSPVAEYISDLSHLGTYAEDREAALRALLIEPALRLPSKRFLIGGPQYPKMFPWCSNIFYRSHVSPAEHPAFYCSSRFTLNVTRRVMANMGFCPSNRLFEAAACGAAIISDPWPGLEQFFEPGEEILVADHPDDVIYALSIEDSQRERIGRRARERALAEHSASCRAREMEQLLEGSFRVGVSNLSPV
jgi:spore maturation protein CgeB